MERRSAFDPSDVQHHHIGSCASAALVDVPVHCESRLYRCKLWVGVADPGGRMHAPLFGCGGCVCCPRFSPYCNLMLLDFLSIILMFLVVYSCFQFLLCKL